MREVKVIAAGEGAGKYTDRDDLRRLVDQVDVAELVMSYDPDGLREKSGTDGDGLRCKCPFPDHDDRHPSFHIWISGERKGRYSCSCSKGDVFQFVRRMEAIDFEEPVGPHFLRGRLPRA